MSCPLSPPSPLAYLDNFCILTIDKLEFSVLYFYLFKYGFLRQIQVFCYDVSAMYTLIQSSNLKY
jgi:hypothetical protein